MQVQVKLVGAFQVGRFKEKTCVFPVDSTIDDAVDSLGLPRAILGTVLIDGRHADLTQKLKAGERLTILPLLEGG